MATKGSFCPSSGHLAVIADPIGLHVVDCTTGKELRLILKSTAISAMRFSPHDSFLVTCEKFVKDEKNLVVWSLATGREVAMWEWRKGSKEGTKSIKFTEDERFCARLSSRTQIELFEGGNFINPMSLINAENLAKKAPKNEEEKKSNKNWFDGFEFVPSHTSPTGI